MFDELDEDEAPGMTVEELAKNFKNFVIPKGFARTSFMLASKRYNDNMKLPEDKRALPKKVINRVHYQFIEALDKTKDPAQMLAGINFIHDRLDGKAPQAVNLGDHEGGKLEITWRES
mgnify:CR=1 FL=1